MNIARFAKHKKTFRELPPGHHRVALCVAQTKTHCFVLAQLTLSQYQTFAQHIPDAYFSDTGKDTCIIDFFKTGLAMSLLQEFNNGYPLPQLLDKESLTSLAPQPTN